MITVDTSVVLAVTNQRDTQHHRALTALNAAEPPYVIPTAVLSEIAYMLESRGWYKALEMILADIESGYFELDCGDENIPRVRQLISRYNNLPLGLADASVIACAERHGGTVLSLDRDFRIVGGEGTIRILPD